MASSLVSRNVIVAGHRTSMRLEPEMWGALAEIGAAEGLSLNDLCSKVAKARGHSSLTSAVRIFALSYFRAKAGSPPAGGPLVRALEGDQRQAWAPPADNRAK